MIDLCNIACVDQPIEDVLEPIDEHPDRAVRAIQWLVRYMINERHPKMIPLDFYCLAYVMNFLLPLGMNQVDIANRFGITKAEVSKRCRKIAEDIRPLFPVQNPSLRNDKSLRNFRTRNPARISNRL